MTGRRRSLLLVLGLSFKRAVLFGIGIAAGSLIALAVFEWGGLAVLGFSNEANQVGYLIIAGVGILLSFGLLEIKLLYHGWLKPSQESKERTRLQRDRAILETDVANLRNEYANLTTELTASQQSLQDVQKQLASSRADLATLAYTQAEEKRQIESLRQISNARRQEINSLEVKLGNLHHEQSKSESTIQTATRFQDQVAHLQPKVDALTARIQDLEATGAQLSNEQKALEATKEHSTAQIAELSQELVQMREKATELDDQCHKAQIELEALRQERVEAEAIVTQRSEAQTQLEQLKAELGTLQKRQEQILPALEALKATQQQLGDNCSSLGIDISRLSQQKAQLEKELSDLRHDQQEALAIIQQRDEAQSQLEQLDQRMSAIQVKMSALQSQIDELDRLIERKKQVETSIGDLYHEVDSLKQELENKSSTIVQVKGELGELLAKPDFMRGAGWQDVEKRLRGELSQLEDRKRAIENRIEHLWNEIRNCQRGRIEIDQAIAGKGK